MSDKIELSMKRGRPLEFKFVEKVDRFLEKINETPEVKEYRKVIFEFNSKIGHLFLGAIPIENQDDWNVWDSEVVKVRGVIANLDNIRKAINKPINEAKKGVQAYYHLLTEKAIENIEKIDESLVQFSTQQELKQKEEQRKIEEEARIKEDELRKAVVEKAKKLEDEGNFTEADQLREEKVWVPHQVLPDIPKTIKTESSSTTLRDDIKVEVESIIAFIKAIITGDLPGFYVAYINININKLKKHIRDTEIKSLPGIRIESSKQIARKIK